MGWIVRIAKSFFALPLWVIVWICLFLVPANFAGFAFLNTVSGFWISLLGAGAIILNLGLVWLNGGFSKVLCIPHVLFWTPLVGLLAYRLFAVEMASDEYWLALSAFVINGVSLFFDFYDLHAWRRGHRQIAGYETSDVRF